MDIYGITWPKILVQKRVQDTAEVYHGILQYAKSRSAARRSTPLQKALKASKTPLNTLEHMTKVLESL